MSPLNFTKGCQLSYKIPERERIHPKTGHKSRGPIFPNPAAELHAIGIPIDGSVWLIPMHRIPVALLEKMEKAGCTVNTINYDESERGKILAMVRQGLTDRAAEIRAFIAESVDKTGKEIEAARVAFDAEKQGKAVRYTAACFRRAKARIDAALEASMGFDIMQETAELFQGVRETLAAESEAFYARHSVEKPKPRKRSSSAPVDQTPEASTLPQPVNL